MPTEPNYIWMRIPATPEARLRAFRSRRGGAPLQSATKSARRAAKSAGSPRRGPPAAKAAAGSISFDDVVSRTVAMLATILHVSASSIRPDHALRDDYGYTDDSLENLRAPINGYWFKDVGCKITPGKLRACTDVASLCEAIDGSIP